MFGGGPDGTVPEKGFPLLQCGVERGTGGCRGVCNDDAGVCGLDASRVVVVAVGVEGYLIRRRLRN